MNKTFQNAVTLARVKKEYAEILCRPKKGIPAPDIYTDSRVMSWLL